MEKEVYSKNDKFDIQYFIDAEKETIACKIRPTDEFFENLYDTMNKSHVPDANFIVAYCRDVICQEYVATTSVKDNDTFDKDFGKSIAYKLAVGKLKSDMHQAKHDFDNFFMSQKRAVDNSITKYVDKMFEKAVIRQHSKGDIH